MAAPRPVCLASSPTVSRSSHTRPSRSFPILTAVLWTLSRSFMSLLRCGPQPARSAGGEAAQRRAERDKPSPLPAAVLSPGHPPCRGRRTGAAQGGTRPASGRSPPAPHLGALPAPLGDRRRTAPGAGAPHGVGVPALAPPSRGPAGVSGLPCAPALLPSSPRPSRALVRSSPPLSPTSPSPPTPGAPRWSGPARRRRERRRRAGGRRRLPELSLSVEAPSPAERRRAERSGAGRERRGGGERGAEQGSGSGSRRRAAP